MVAESDTTERFSAHTCSSDNNSEDWSNCSVRVLLRYHLLFVLLSPQALNVIISEHLFCARHSAGQEGDRCVDMNAGRAAAAERTRGHGNTGTLVSFPKGCDMLKIVKLTLQQSPGS